MTITELKDNLLSLSRERFDGISYNYAAKTYEISPEGMEKLALCAEAALKAIDLKLGSEAIWPYNLVEELAVDLLFDNRVNQWRPSNKLVFPLCEDQIKGLDYVISFFLTERERDCVLRYYRDGEKYETIGRDYGVTRERIRQVIARALRKLRHPSKFRYIARGYAAASGEIREAELALHAEEIKKARECVQAQLNAAREIPTTAHRQSESILELDLSVRAYNCLKRAGLNKIGDILDLPSLESFKTIRNLGLKCTNEIIKRLNESGFFVLNNGTPLKKLEASHVR